MEVLSVPKTGFSFEKLGFDNYKDWVYYITLLLRKEGCWKVFQEEVEAIDLARREKREPATFEYDEEDVDKAEKALAFICMSIGNAQRVHVRGADTPGEAWVALRDAFKNKGNEDPTVLKMKFLRLQLEEG